jgi:hypothetical protein
MRVTELSNILLEEDIPGRHGTAAGYHPLILVLTFVITVAIIWISAWLPAGKLSRLIPLEAIKNAEELQLKHRRKFTLLTHLAGMEGELRELNGVESAVVYQRAAAKRVITEKGMSEEMKRSLCGRKLKGRSGSGILLCLA